METTITNFWCGKCKKDIIHRYAEKGVISKREFWITGCPICGQRLLRWCSDHKLDPYYFESEKMQREAKQYADDFLQPDHPRFDEVYPWVRREREAKLAAKKLEEEKAAWDKDQKIVRGQRKKFTI
jgi:hypothetical protein